MTYEDFIDRYLDHIEGRAPRDSRPYTADTSQSKDREPTPPANKRGGKAAPKAEEKKEEEAAAEEGEQEEEKDEKQLEVNMSRVTIHTTKSEKELKKQRKKEAKVKRFNLGDECKHTILRKNVIEEMSKRFFLVVHPYPLY